MEVAVILSNLARHSAYIKGTTSYLLAHVRTNVDMIGPHPLPIEIDRLNSDLSGTVSAVSSLQEEVLILQTEINAVRFGDRRWQYSRMSLIQTSINQIRRLTKHQICAVRPHFSVAMCHQQPFSYAIRRASGVTKQNGIDFSDLLTLTNIQRLQRRMLAGVVCVWVYNYIFDIVLVIRTFQLSEQHLFPTSWNKRHPTVYVYIIIIIIYILLYVYIFFCEIQSMWVW